MSALEQVLSIGSVKAEHPRLYAKAVAELVALRATLEDIRQATIMPDGKRLSDEFIRVMTERDTLNARVAELEAQAAQPDTLTPRQCRACQAAAEKMREAAADVSCWSCLHDVPMTSETIGSRTFTDIHKNGVLCTAIKIRALPLPDCGACNPLEPDDHDAAMLEAWHERM